jgi:hypothetical protein
MLTVYRVLADVDHYQYLLADDVNALRKYPFDGSPVTALWEQPAVYVANPSKPKGDFLGCFSYASVFAATPEVYRRMRTVFDESSEMLPLNYQEGELLICNVTNVLNCLDKKNSSHKPGVPHWIDKYAFFAHRFNYSLFKIPETSEVFCVEGAAAAEDEFKGKIEILGLKGLDFRKVWSQS